jgi:hypothetical protein
MCDSMDAAPSQKSSIGVQSPRVYFSASFGPTTPTRGTRPPASDGDYLPAGSKVRAPPPYASPKTSRGFAFLESKHLLSENVNRRRDHEITAD